jgi:hypothetical protein
MQRVRTMPENVFPLAVNIEMCKIKALPNKKS